MLQAHARQLDHGSALQVPLPRLISAVLTLWNTCCEDRIFDYLMTEPSVHLAIELLDRYISAVKVHRRRFLRCLSMQQLLSSDAANY